MSNGFEIPLHPFLDRKVPICSTLRVSIVVPTKEASQHIGTTIESILYQRNARFEVIFIDAESQDSTVEIIRSYNDSRFRIQSVPSKKTYEMINRGVAMAQGDYILVLMPGDVFLYPDALALSIWQISQNDFPDLFYSASFLRDEWYEPHFLFRPLKRELLRAGQQPAHLHSSWIKRSVFKEVGFFNIDLEIRGTLDFFIRFSRNPHLVASSEMRIYVDPEPVSVDLPYLCKNFKETFGLILKNYGALWPSFGSSNSARQKEWFTESFESSIKVLRKAKICFFQACYNKDTCCEDSFHNGIQDSMSWDSFDLNRGGMFQDILKCRICRIRFYLYGSQG
jgi:glycosyltransferase involved in cell wall biosynthesis